MPKNTNSIVMGVDVGLMGAIAILGKDHSEILPMPVYWCQVGKKRRKKINEPAIFDILQKYNPSLVAVEVPYVAPVVSKLSISSLFYQYGFWVGVLRSLQFPYHLIPPKEWQKHFGISRKQTKQQSMQICSRLYPSMNIKKDGASDALLIATYAAGKFPTHL